MKQLSSLAQWRQGAIDAAPIGLSFIMFGGIFGMLSVQAGLATWQSVGMSVIVFAGAAQFTSLPMIAEQASIWSIILATFLLNSRHLLMGLSISPYYAGHSRLFINTMAFFLTDEQYAITLNRFRQHESNAAYVWAVSLLLYFAWMMGTWLGTVAGNWLPDPNALGLGYSFTAMFLALAYYQLTSVTRIATFFLCGAAAVALAFVLPNGLHLLAAGAIAFSVGYLMPAEKEGVAV